MIKKLLWISLLLTGCNKAKNTDALDPYFFAATVDGVPWKINHGKNYCTTSFAALFDRSQDHFYIQLGGSDQNPNAVCQYMAINFRFVPTKGRYYLNNIGSNQIDSGIIGIYTYFNVNTSFTKWSSGGFVDIDSISKNEMSGRFNFTAVGDATNPEITNITSGSFRVLNQGGGEFVWPGP